MILFAQPKEPGGIAGHFFVPTASGGSAPPIDQFALILWQPNPNTPNGLLIPSDWNAGAFTGLNPSPLLDKQVSFKATQSTTAQMGDGTVGAYLNSADLPGSPPGQKMMITPQYSFSSAGAIFAADTTLAASMDLQIPTATGEDTYLSPDALFLGPGGMRLSLATKLFINGAVQPTYGAGYIPETQTYMVNTPLMPIQPFLTVAAGSALVHAAPFFGYRRFAWSTTQAQFTAALHYLAGAYPADDISTDPADYTLAAIHLNAEFHFNPGPATLGWAMRNWSVTLNG